jgi:hypothetical protein
MITRPRPTVGRRSSDSSRCSSTGSRSCASHPELSARWNCGGQSVSHLKCRKFGIRHTGCLSIRECSISELSCGFGCWHGIVTMMPRPTPMFQGRGLQRGVCRLTEGHRPNPIPTYPAANRAAGFAKSARRPGKLAGKLPLIYTTGICTKRAGWKFIVCISLRCRSAVPHSVELSSGFRHF